MHSGSKKKEVTPTKNMLRVDLIIFVHRNFAICQRRMPATHIACVIVLNARYEDVEGDRIANGINHLL